MLKRLMCTDRCFNAPGQSLGLPPHRPDPLRSGTWPRRAARPGCLRRVAGAPGPERVRRPRADRFGRRAAATDTPPAFSPTCVWTGRRAIPTGRSACSCTTRIHTGRGSPQAVTRDSMTTCTWASRTPSATTTRGPSGNARTRPVAGVPQPGRPRPEAALPRDPGDRDQGLWKLRRYQWNSLNTVAALDESNTTVLDERSW